MNNRWKYLTGVKKSGLGRVRIVTVIVFVLSCWTSLAAAAEPGGGKDGMPAQYTLDAITVTAQKKEENVQEIPMGISVFTNERIEETGARNARDILRYAPNVFVKDSGSYFQTTIRGVSGFVTSTHSAAGYYVDDVSLPAVFMQNPDLLDIERVEVLKGPQGTLYGRNSESGVINIVTRQPGNELRGRIFNEVSFYDTNHGYAPGNKTGMNISGPVVEDTLYMGFAGTWNYNQGFVKNDAVNDDKARRVNTLNGRGTVRWTPVDEWDISLMLDAQDSRDKFAYGRYLAGDHKTGRGHADMDARHYRNYNGNGQTLRAKYSGRDFDFVSITGRQSFDEKFMNDMDLTRNPVYAGDMRDKERFWSQEMRLSSPGETKSPFTWLTGMYFFREDLDMFSGQDMNMAVPFPMSFRDERDTDITMKGWALFGEGTYTLFERLRLTAGLRYDHSRLRGKQRYTSGMMMTESSYSSSSKEDEILPKFSVAFDLTADIMTYATVSKGYLSGGYDYASGSTKDGFAYKPEYSWNYEWGMKTAWLDNRLTANLALFYVDMEDKQVSEMDANSFTMNMSNAGKAHSYGAEFELAARPLQGLDIFGGVGYTKAKIDEWEAFDGVAMVDYAGSYLPNVPRVTYTVGIQYRHETGLWGRLELVGTGKHYHDAKNELKEKSYEIVNLRLGYEGDDFDFTLWCKNVFDKEYNNVQFTMPGWGRAAFEGDPRQFGVTVAYKF